MVYVLAQGVELVKMHVLSDGQIKVHYLVPALKFLLWMYLYTMAKQPGRKRMHNIIKLGIS